MSEAKTMHDTEHKAVESEEQMRDQEQGERGYHLLSTLTRHGRLSDETMQVKRKSSRRLLSKSQVFWPLNQDIRLTSIGTSTTSVSFSFSFSIGSSSPISPSDSTIG